MADPDDDDEAPIPSRLGQQMRPPLAPGLRVALVAGFAGLALLPLIWDLVIDLRLQARLTGRAIGEVAEIITHYTPRSGNSSRPVYHFQTADGRDIRVEHPRNSMFTGAGNRFDAVPLRYDPADPQVAQRDSPVARWSDAWFYGLIGAMLAGGMITALRDIWLAFRLRHRGIVLDADIQRIKRGAKGSWTIETGGMVPGTPHGVLCRSERLWVDPGPFIAGRRTLPVLVDPRKPERALLIAEFLPLTTAFGLRRRADAVWEERRRQAPVPVATPPLPEPPAPAPAPARVVHWVAGATPAASVQAAPDAPPPERRPASRLGQRMAQPVPLLQALLPRALALAAVLSLPMLAFMVQEARFLARATGRAEGELIVHDVGSAGGPVAAPSYRFCTSYGREVEMGPRRDSFITAHHPGPVPLRYDPWDPEAVQQDSAAARWGDAWLCGLLPLAGLLGLCRLRRVAIRTAWLAFRLRRRGIVVEATIWRVAREDPGGWEGLPKSWMIEAGGQVPGSRDFTCRAIGLPENPLPFIAGRATLPALVDPRRPEHALLIAEFLPLAPDFGLRHRAEAIWEQKRAMAGRA
ncbi:MAG TPA: DUF3592 domain-containing protein [Roseomonas sp.]|jgi:hypothetical protein